MKARYLITAMASVVAGVAMFGSAASLHEIAVADHLAAAWTMPVCLDLLAITTTTAAVVAGQRGALVHIGPPIAYLISLALQVSAAWAYGPRAWAVHAIPLVAAAYLSEVLLRMWAPAADVEPAAVAGEPVIAPPVAATPKQDSRTPNYEHLGQVAEGDSSPSAKPPTTVRVQRQRRPASERVDYLVREAIKLAERRGAAPTDLTQAVLKAELHIGSNRAGDVYHAIRRPHLGIVSDQQR